MARPAAWPTGFALKFLLASAVCSPRAILAEGPIILRDVTKQSGIGFRHTDGGGGRYYIVETVASGLATLDYDEDGLIDIYFLNGRPLRGTAWQDPPPTNRLYRNLGGLRFVDATDKAGVGDAGFGLGVAVGDYDNDGLPDMYVNNYGPNVLYHNNGDGTFTDVTKTAGAGRADKVGAGANFLDIDGDGNLDLFVANYIAFTYENHVASIVRGTSFYSGPLSFPKQPNQLFRNNGDGTFTEISAESGIGAHAGAGMGTIALDYDNDGRTDIFVCNDEYWNFLFRNEGGGKFREVALAAGVSGNFAGEPVAGMGADVADYDHDGRLDLFMTDYREQHPILYRNLGGGAFEDVTMQAGAAAGSFPYIKWGCGFVDFDNDGHPDLFIGCGHLGEYARRVDLPLFREADEVAPVLLRNTGHGKFVNVSNSSGDGMRVKLVARGIAFDDLDNDGRGDVVILNSRRPPTILRNESVTGNHWVQIRLRGVKTNRDGVGARVKVVAGDLAQTAEVHSGRGYQSHWGSLLHFGLGKHDRVDRIEVRWIGGGDVLENVPANRLLTIREGSKEASGTSVAKGL
jgi:hypothetical protein